MRPKKKVARVNLQYASSSDSDSDGTPKPKTLKQQYEKKQYDELIHKATFAGPEYSYDSTFAPNMAFYKFLAKSPNWPSKNRNPKFEKLNLWVPDTVILNDGKPIWIYTTIDGYVSRIEEFRDKHILNKLENDQNLNDVALVLKKTNINPRTRRPGLNTAPMTSHELDKRLNDLLHGERVCLQKFIRCKGPRDFVCRTVYRRNARSYCYIFTNKANYNDGSLSYAQRCCSSVNDRDSFTWLFANTGQYLEQTLPLIGRLIKFLESNMKIRFEEFVGDFLKDEGGTWWFITCKAFKLFPGDPPDLSKFISEDADPAQFMKKVSFVTGEVIKEVGLPEYQRLQRCKLCQIEYPQSALRHHQMTLKMIIEVDNHLRSRGIFVKWLDRSEYRHTDMATLYQSYCVCKYCFKFYQLTEELKSLMGIYARGMGIPEKPQHPEVANPGTLSMPDGWDFDVQLSGKAVVVVNEVPCTEQIESLAKPLHLYRIMVVLDEIRELSDVFDPTKNYTIEYELLTQHHKAKIDAAKYINRNLDFAPIHSIRLFHIYSISELHFQQYLSKKPILELRLCWDGHVMGRARCDLTDFSNPIVVKKNYYQLIDIPGSELPYIRCSIGMQKGGLESIAGIKLNSHYSIFIPPEDYAFCELLPTEWLEILPDIKTFRQMVLDRYDIQYPIESRMEFSASKFTIQTSRTLASSKYSRPSTGTGKKKTLRPKTSRPINRKKSKTLLRHTSEAKFMKSQLKSINKMLPRSPSDGMLAIQEKSQTWQLKVQIEDIKFDEHVPKTQWKIMFEIFDAVYAGEGETKKNKSLKMNLGRIIYLRGLDRGLKLCLSSRKVNLKLLMNGQVSTSSVPLNELRAVDSQSTSLEFPFDDYTCTINITLALEKYNKTQQWEKVRSLEHGLELIKF